MALEMLDNLWELVNTLWNIIPVIFSVIYYFINLVEAFLSVIFDPFFMLIILMTYSNFYVILKSQTRKQIILNYGNCAKLSGQAIFSLYRFVVTIAIYFTQATISVVNSILNFIKFW